MVFLSSFLFCALEARNSRCWIYSLQVLSSRFNFEHACCTALSSEEGNFPSTRKIFLTCTLGRKLSISFEGIGRYFSGDDESREIVWWGYLNANALLGRAKDLVHSFCYWLGLKLSCLVMFVLLVCDLCQTTYTLRHVCSWIFLKKPLITQAIQFTDYVSFH